MLMNNNQNCVSGCVCRLCSFGIYVTVQCMIMRNLHEQVSAPFEMYN